VCAGGRCAPRRLSNADGQAVWQWSYSAFGEDKPTIAKNRFANLDTTPNPGTTSVSEVKFNLRYPGQYADEESGLFYNYFRSYDARTGRYSQPDPIGLGGGWNRFGYVDANPLRFTDAMGLQKTMEEMLGSDYKDSPLSPDYPLLFKRPYVPPPMPPEHPPNEPPEPWPGPDDQKGQCIMLSFKCRQERWLGNCNACELKCIAQGQWPFRGAGSCRPRQKRNSCPAF
jgi:RHS repeat-associated protein